MAELVLLDNDIVLKSCAYGSAVDLIDLAARHNRRLAMLRVAQYAVGRRIQRARDVRDVEGLSGQWAALLPSVLSIEPTQAEIEFAAELEEQAINLSLELDAGESQLFAVLVFRASPLLLTGDKRAIAALEAIGRSLPEERVACLEQFIYSLLDIIGLTNLRTRICREPQVDRSLTISFSCHVDKVSERSVRQGLESYISSVRKSAPTVLLKTAAISAIVS
ncbi:hypothetical protein EOS93_14605 [Rhizobium sp. RMa-01]|uniref:hypothetical protein n=1 Tax=unclassified Rhizobium TaxID=2613769 RepID=UPI000FE0EC41|nr:MULTISPECIES: hypothetical protein [unclassified Rhizobium]RVU10597.1 hypothetical protein EOS93_14605 [Rhizobium sp. RMa-01]